MAIVLFALLANKSPAMLIKEQNTNAKKVFAIPQESIMGDSSKKE